MANVHTTKTRITYSPPRRGGVARQLNRSWRAGVVSPAEMVAGLLLRLRPIGLALRATPSAPSAQLLLRLRPIGLALRPLICEEGNVFFSTINQTVPGNRRSARGSEGRWRS